MKLFPGVACTIAPALLRCLSWQLVEGSKLKAEVWMCCSCQKCSREETGPPLRGGVPTFPFSTVHAPTWNTFKSGTFGVSCLTGPCSQKPSVGISQQSNSQAVAAWSAQAVPRLSEMRTQTPFCLSSATGIEWSHV